MSLPKNILQWSVADVAFWLEENHFQSEVGSFKEHQIDGKALTLLEKSDVNELIKTIGPRVKFRCKLSQLLLTRNINQPGNHTNDVNNSQRNESAQSKDVCIGGIVQPRYNFVQVYPSQPQQQVLRQQQVIPQQQVLSQIRYHPVENGPNPQYYNQGIPTYGPYNYQTVYPIRDQQLHNVQPGNPQFMNRQQQNISQGILNAPGSPGKQEKQYISHCGAKRRHPSENESIINREKANSMNNELKENSHAGAITKTFSIKQEPSSLEDDDIYDSTRNKVRNHLVDENKIENATRNYDNGTFANTEESKGESSREEHNSSLVSKTNREPSEESDKEMFDDEDEEDCREMDRICENMSKNCDDHEEFLSMLNIHKSRPNIETLVVTSEIDKVAKDKQIKSENKPSIESVTNRLALRERSKIFRRSEKKWHIAVNETSYQLVQKDPKLLHNKRELRLLAESEVRKTYRFAKGKSRSIAIPENRVAAEEKKKQKMTKEKIQEAKKRLNSERENVSRKMRQCHMNLTLANQQSDSTQVMQLREEMQVLNHQQAKLHFRMTDLLAKERKLRTVKKDPENYQYQVVNDTSEQPANMVYYPSSVPTQISVLSPSSRVQVDEHGQEQASVLSPLSRVHDVHHGQTQVPVLPPSSRVHVNELSQTQVRVLPPSSQVYTNTHGQAQASVLPPSSRVHVDEHGQVIQIPSVNISFVSTTS